jgi:hypothetical protein
MIEVGIHHIDYEIGSHPFCKAEFRVAPVMKTYRMRIQVYTHTNKRIRAVTFQRCDLHENTYKPINFIILDGLLFVYLGQNN